MKEKKTMESIAILGAGNGGCALAADLSMRGYEIRLYADPKHRKKLDAVQSAGGITLEGALKGFSSIQCLTTKLEEAVSGAKHVLISLPSCAQEKIFKEYLDFLEPGQVVVSMNGNMSVFCFVEIMRKKKIHNIFLAEANALPYACRVERDAQVNILAIKKSVSIGSLPATPPPSIKEKLETIFPCKLEWCEDILEVGLQANNGVIHPPAAILNTGWMETRKGNFYFYKDGISQAVAKVIEKIDSERREIALRYGFDLRSLLEEFEVFYEDKFESIADFAANTRLHNLIKEAPATVEHRYITEDVPYVLVPWYLLGKLVGYEATTIKSLITLSSVLNETEPFQQGRNLENMGIEKLGPVQLIKSIRGLQNS